jgi:DNA-directed RNA polymerase subunit L
MSVPEPYPQLEALSKKDTINPRKPPVISIEIQGNAEIPNELTAILTGPAADGSIGSAIRRSLASVPIAAFMGPIQFEQNKYRTRYSRKMIAGQLSQLVIYSVPNYFDLEDPETYLSAEISGALFPDLSGSTSCDPESDDPSAGSRMPKIKLIVDYQNRNKKVHILSTHDCQLYINGMLSRNYLSKPPIGIMDLAQGEGVSFQTEAIYGLGDLNGSFFANTTGVSRELPDESQLIQFETRGQLPAKTILQKGLTIIRKKLINLAEYIQSTFEDKDGLREIQLVITGEDDTLGFLLQTVLQKYRGVEAAAYHREHLMVKSVTISWKTDEKHKPYATIVLCTRYLIDLFQSLEDQIQ